MTQQLQLLALVLMLMLLCSVCALDLASRAAGAENCSPDGSLCVRAQAAEQRRGRGAATDFRPFLDRICGARLADGCLACIHRGDADCGLRAREIYRHATLVVLNARPAIPSPARRNFRCAARMAYV